MRKRVLVGAAALVFVALTATGCVRVEIPQGEFTQSSESVSLGNAKSVSAEIEMAAGQLDIGPGAESLMDAEFGYSDTAWKPTVKYQVIEDRGELRVRTSGNPQWNMSNTRFEWDVLLAKGVPLDLRVQMGAGECDIDLRGLDVRELEVELGAGDSAIDLSGEWMNDLRGVINASAGSVTLKVPEGVGVRIVGYKDGIGGYEAAGFSADGDALVNPAYGTADVNMELTLRRGVGDVVVMMVP